MITTKIIANQCIMLLEIFAKIGIIALVDEVTGYQKDRPANELLSEWKKELKTSLVSYIPQLPNSTPSLGSFTYDPSNNSLTYGEKPFKY